MDSTKHILIIDNDPISRKLFGSLLGRGGYEVIYAKDAQEGYEMAKTSRPDLILLDLHMPGIDGFEAANTFRKDPKSANIPIILLTNEDLPLEAQKWMKDMGVKDYIQKGVGNEKFIELVKNFFEASSQSG